MKKLVFAAMIAMGMFAFGAQSAQAQFHNHGHMHGGYNMGGFGHMHNHGFGGVHGSSFYNPGFGSQLLIPHGNHYHQGFISPRQIYINPGFYNVPGSFRYGGYGNSFRMNYSTPGFYLGFGTIFR